MKLPWSLRRHRCSLRLEVLEDRTMPALAIVSTSPVVGSFSVSVPMTTLDFHFDNPINPASVQVTDLALLRNGGSFGAVSAAQVVPGTNNQTVRFTLSGVTTPGPLTAYMRPGSVAAANGDPNDTFTGNYTLVSLGFNPVQPLGGLMQTTTGSGSIVPNGTAFTFGLDAGQSVTLVATPDAGNASQVTLRLFGPDPDGPGPQPPPELGSTTAAQAGVAALLQTLPAATTGVYTAVVTGTAPGAVSTFKLRAVLNAAQEAEGNGGPTNNTPATAQDLTGAFLPITATSDRGGVSGFFTGSVDHYAVALQAGQPVSVALSQSNPNNRLFNPTTVISQSPQVGVSPTDVAVGDLNGGGLPDLVYPLANVGAVGAILVHYATGSGTYFQGATVPSGGTSPQMIRLGDLDGDGKLDAVVANQGSGNIGVLFGTGNDPFQGETPPPAFSNPVVYAAGTSPRALALGDLNNDGKLDIVVGNAQGNQLGVFLNNGNGTFAPRVPYSAGGFIINGVAIGDVTGDGNADIVAITVDNANLAVLPGDGQGSFGTPILDPSGGAIPQDVVLADFNNDGRLDAAVMNRTGTVTQPVAVFLNQNNAADPFGPSIITAVGSSATATPVYRLMAADFDGDGRTDLAATMPHTGLAMVMLGNGAGGFDTRLPVNLGAAGTSTTGLAIGITAADTNGDGTADLVTANAGNNVSVLVNGLSRLRVDLVNAAGTVLAAGVATGNATSAISNFVAPATDTYFLRVSGAGRTDYAAVVTRGVAFEAESNNTSATAQNLDGNPGVLGHVGRPDRLFAALPGSPGVIQELNPVTGAVIRSFSAPAATAIGTNDPVGLAFDGKSLFFLRYAGAPFTLYELDPDTGAVRDSDIIPFGSNGIDGLAALNGRIYLADHAGNTIIGFDPVTDTITHSIALPGTDLLGGLAGITGPDRLLATVNSVTANVVRVVEIDPVTGRMTAQFTTGAAGGTMIPNGGARGLAAVNGEVYIARIDGGSRMDVYSRSGTYLRTVIGSGLNMPALGGDDLGQSSVDWYSFTAVDGQTIQLETSTPADGLGDFGNSLNPRLELFSPTGALLVTGTPGPDGRNETITLTAPASGSYRVRVTSQGNTSGEYLLTTNVTPAGQASASNDTASTTEDTPTEILVLANDSGYDSATVQVRTGPSHGSVTVAASGAITYTPVGNFSGADSFTYTVRDANGVASNTATVNITVTPVVDTPTVTATSPVTGNENAAIPLTIAAALTDTDGSEVLSLTIGQLPAGGTLSAGTSDGNGTWTLTLAQLVGLTLHLPDNLPGEAEFQLVILATAQELATGASTSASAPLAVTVRNVAPTATWSAPSTAVEGDLVTLSLTNATDVSPTDRDAGFTYAFDLGSGYGAFSATATASFTPTDNGSYPVRAKVRDKDGGETEYTQTITVTNADPIANAGADQTANEGDTVTLVGAFTDAGSADTHTVGWQVVNGNGQPVASSSGTTLTFVPADNGTYTATFTVTDDDGATSADSATVTVANVAPTPLLTSVSTPRQEGSAITATGSATDPAGPNDTITLSWAVFKNGSSVAFATATGSSCTFTPDDNGSYRIVLTAADEDGGSQMTEQTVTVMNLAPTATVSGPASGVRGQSLAFTLSASDPSAVDQANAISYRIDWGDGTTETVSGSAVGLSAAHAFAAAGNYTVRVWATDKDGAEGDPATTTIQIKTAELQGGDLLVAGTAAGEQFVLAPANATGGVRVTVNGADQGVFTPTGQIVVFARAGNDSVRFDTTRIGRTTYSVTRPLLLLGGDGSDTLDARNTTGASVQLGEAGNDTLFGGGGRAILIGGLGTDNLQGGSAEDILLGGLTLHDDNLTALAAWRAEWSRTDASYAVRIGHLRDGTAGGLNGGFLLNPASAVDDGVADTVAGNGGQDWFFLAAGDANDRKNNETSTGY